MNTFTIEAKPICAHGERILDHVDPATARPVYVAAGYVQDEPEEPYTWRLFWHGSGLSSWVAPALDAQPFKAVEISTGRVVSL